MNCKHVKIYLRYGSWSNSHPFVRRTVPEFCNRKQAIISHFCLWYYIDKTILFLLRIIYLFPTVSHSRTKMIVITGDETSIALWSRKSHNFCINHNYSKSSCNKDTYNQHLKIILIFRHLNGFISCITLGLLPFLLFTNCGCVALPCISVTISVESLVRLI